MLICFGLQILLLDTFGANRVEYVMLMRNWNEFHFYHSDVESKVGGDNFSSGIEPTKIKTRNGYGSLTVCIRVRVCVNIYKL